MSIVVEGGASGMLIMVAVDELGASVGTPVTADNGGKGATAI